MVAAAIFPVGNGKDETSKTDPKGEGLRAQTESIPSGGAVAVSVVAVVYDRQCRSKTGTAGSKGATIMDHRYIKTFLYQDLLD